MGIKAVVIRRQSLCACGDVSEVKERYSLKISEAIRWSFTVVVGGR